MCDFIHNQNIKSLIEYIVTKHLFAASPNSVTDRPSLEDVATPYVQTLTILRRTYEDDLRQANEQVADHEGRAQSNGVFFDNSAARTTTGRSEKALEDQVRLLEWIRRLAHYK
jgi:protein phosphatase-4 regulatory subunit 3